VVAFIHTAQQHLTTLAAQHGQEEQAMEKGGGVDEGGSPDRDRSRGVGRGGPMMQRERERASF